jgi:hypothetical protein
LIDFVRKLDHLASPAASKADERSLSAQIRFLVKGYVTENEGHGGV